MKTTLTKYCEILSVVLHEASNVLGIWCIWISVMCVCMILFRTYTSIKSSKRSRVLVPYFKAVWWTTICFYCCKTIRESGRLMTVDDCLYSALLSLRILEYAILWFITVSLCMRRLALIFNRVKLITNYVFIVVSWRCFAPELLYLWSLAIR